MYIIYLIILYLVYYTFKRSISIINNIILIDPLKDNSCLRKYQQNITFSKFTFSSTYGKVNAFTITSHFDHQFTFSYSPVIEPSFYQNVSQIVSSDGLILDVSCTESKCTICRNCRSCSYLCGSCFGPSDAYRVWKGILHH